MRWFILGFVVLYLGVTAFLYYQDMRFVRRGVVVEARVAGVGQSRITMNTGRESRTRTSSTAYKPSYVYELDGKEYSWEPPFMTTSAPKTNTQELVVSRRYPEEAKVNTFFFKYLVPNIMAIIIAFPIALFLLIKFLKMVGYLRVVKSS